jgi:hypothetical protein
MNPTPTPRSLFWPIVLIGAGAVLLLANLNVIPWASLAFLLRLWPLLLIVAGLDILLGRRLPWIGGLIGLALVALVVAFLVAAPRLGLPAAPQAQTGRFVEPVGEAAAAQITLDLSDAHTAIHPLADSADLIDANLVYVGEIEFNVQGEAEKTVSLSQRLDAARILTNPFDLSNEVRWDIGLTSRIPLELTIDGGSGAVEADLGTLQLTGLAVDIGSGQIDLGLPSGGEQFLARFDGGSGQTTIRIPEGAAVELVIEGGSGAFVVEVPDTAVRFEVRQSGSGAVHVPADFTQVTAGEDDEGAWETADYGEAERRIIVTVDDVGSGSITVR